MNENIVKTTYRDKEIWLVKTAHVSLQSQSDVREALDEVKPDTVCIELDKDRYNSLTDKDSWKNTDITSVIKQKKAGYLLVNMILASFQRRMAGKLDTSSGGEMMEGIHYSDEHHVSLVLADRPVKTTFTRIWRNLGLKEKAKLLYTILSSLFDDEEISEEDLAALKQGDALDASLQEIGKDFPVVKKILVDERDQYLAKKIKEAPGQKIVAIIGAAHCQGILANLDKDYELAPLEDTSKKKSWTSCLKWIIPLAILAMIVYSFCRNKDVGMNQLYSWLLWNGCLSALGTIVAGGHLLTILVSFFLAPLTSLSPLLAVGWFAGLTEAKIAQPKVADFENISKDTETWKGFRRNKVTRILLIVILANVFSTIGTVVSGLDIVKNLFTLIH